MNILAEIVNHYGATLSPDQSIGLEFSRIEQRNDGARPYLYIEGTIVSYDGTPRDIHTSFTEELYLDTGTSRRSEYVKNLLRAHPSGISKRELRNRYRILPSELVSIPTYTRRVSTGELTPSGKAKWETRVFLNGGQQ